MSLNDLFDMDLLPILAIFAVICLLLIPVGISRGKKSRVEIYGDNETGEVREKNNVKIISKKTETPVPFIPPVNSITFELDNGSRVELAIKNSDTFNTMYEGDCGTLKYQGKKFISFNREN